MRDFEHPNLPYLKKEVARAPDESSHRASPSRTYVMKQLGVQTPGFWADWAKRKINPQVADNTYQTPTLRTTPGVTKMPTYKSQQIKAYEEKASDLDVTPKVQMQASQARAGGGSATGRTREQLRKGEMGISWSRVNYEIGANRFMGTSVLDTIAAQQINMGRQNVMYMEDHPSSLLGEAMMDYYMRHPDYSAANAMQTNFEKQTSLYSETKKMAAKRLDYAVGQAQETINNAIKQQKANGTYNTPAYNGNMINIGKGNGYNSIPYLSVFG